MGPSAGGSFNPTIKSTNWNRVSIALEEIGTPFINSIPDDINTNDEIDSVIDALADHVRTMVVNNIRKITTSSDHRKLPADVLELIRAKHVKYQELKALIKQKCNISQFILDNLVSEEDGTKKVRIGVADENEGSILFRNLDGYSMNGYRLRVNQSGRPFEDSNFDVNISIMSLQQLLIYTEPAWLVKQPKMDSSPYPQREVYVHNRQQEQAYGYQPKPNVPLVTEDRRVVEVRPHILRTVELERGPVSKSYQPSPQTYTQPQQKPASDNIQRQLPRSDARLQLYPNKSTDSAVLPRSAGRYKICLAQDQNKLQLAYGKSSTLSYDKSVYNEDRKFSHHSAENQQTRGLLKTPTNYDQPKYAHTLQIARMSPPRRASSPMRRISPDKRLISPQGRQDLRKLSPSRKVSPRRRTSPSRRSPPRKSPTANRRLLSPPPRRSSPPRYSPRSYYEDTEKYDTRSSGPSAPQLRSAYEKQTAQNQYSGGYGSSSTQNRAPLPTKSSPWQATKPIYPRDSPTERDIIRHAPENKYQSGAKSAYPRDSSVEREIRHAPGNKYQQGTKSTYRQCEGNTSLYILCPLKRSRSPIRRNRTPPRRSPRKQSPSHRIWAGIVSSPVARCPPSPPTWTDQPRTEKQPNVWQRSEELKQRDYHQKSEEDWKKSTAFVGSRDKYEERSDFARRSGDGVPFEKYRKLHDEPRRPTSPQRKEYSYREEDDRERHGFKHKAVDRSEQVVKHHEDYAKHPDVYSKHQETYNKYPEQFSKRSEPFNKNQEHLYKRHEQLAGRHRQFSESVPNVKNRYSNIQTKLRNARIHTKPLEQFTRRQERQETFPMRQDQYAERRDDRFIRSEENHKQSEGYRYSSDNKRIDSCLGHFDNAPRYEANKAARNLKPVLQS
ncbi:hypothetical protein EVAR_12145_1 [Eumeta japonica]|uniref:Uncharacterized protein n=1 Tax=Eumeta variegata TaxID=151549 RepID=A0A4C1UGY8_EUMVA|nr:hypothetical protein EVAR_12145_1 [Eumeta japonica]